MVERNWRLRIAIDLPVQKHNSATASDGIYERLKQLKRALQAIQVKGLPQIRKGVISKEDPKKDKDGNVKPNKDGSIPKPKFTLLLDGYGLSEVMGTDGVNGLKSKTNHVMETAQVLGIEAARQTIYNEIQHTMQSHGMSIDPRHVMLLGDVMTYKGEVLGITRFGVQKMKDSVLMLASFEKTTDHLVGFLRVRVECELTLV
jgi:DNA-directed RNA polymerase III subunit RPC1